MKRFAVGLALLTGCFSAPAVTRVYDGNVVRGGFVPDTAYAAYLRGVISEESGDLRGAITAYQEAAREDDEDPEPLTRIGDVSCRVDPTNRAADESLSRALRIDSTYAPAIAARARCFAARGKPLEGMALLERIGAGDRQSTSLEALFVTIAGANGKGRERAIALTNASGEHPAAWDALIAWGRGRGDAELLARGLEGLLAVAPRRSAEVEASALELLGNGQTNLARRVAARLADASPDLEIRGIADATVARLAVDEAILDGRAERVERRAIRGRVPLSEAAARALILERPELARMLARGIAAADPGASGASMVLVALGARSVIKAGTDRPPAACVLVVADRLARTSDSEAARAFIARIGEIAPMVLHDPVTSPLAVDLAARGIVKDSALPLELRLELAARRREAPPPVDAKAIDERVVDAKHALLWHSLSDPTSASTKTLLARLAAATERDPLVAYALTRAALTAPPRSAEAWAPIQHAVAASPADPLLLAAAVDLAKHTGADLPSARTRLFAAARTPAERALARE